jgi:transcriptional regulator with XRE-family HTH domain
MSSAEFIDLASLGKRIANVRRTYGESIDLADLDPALFAVMLGVRVATYASYERGEAHPSAGFLVALRKKTAVSLDWLLDPS